MKKLITLTLTLVFVTCAQASGASGPAKVPTFEPGKPVEFLFDSGVPSKNVNIIKKDLSVLHDLQLSSTDARTLQLFEMNKLDTLSMETWLSTRAKVIVDQSYDISKKAYIVQQFYNFPNPGQMPTIEEGNDIPNSKPQAGQQVVMAALNIGGGVYLAGKMQDVLLGLKLSDGTYLEAKTPRIGLLQSGAGLMSKAVLANAKNLDSIANSLARLQIYFHEARHSDGNGKSLVFAHAVCPAGHDFAGYNACDRNLNGPYTMGATSLGVMMNSCTSCSAEELEVLKLIKADSYNRVLKETPVSSGGVDAGSIQSLINLYRELENMTDDPAKKAEYEAQIQKLQEQLKGDGSGETTPSTDWDATPEGA